MVRCNAPYDAMIRLTLVAIVILSAALARADERPNLIFVFADQLRADTLGYAGDAKARTPHLDAFAAESMRFTNAVTTMPVCAAYRSSLFTGKYPSSTGVVINEVNMNPNHRSIAHVLADAGYDLGYVGKWHLNDQHGRPTPRGPERLGFDGFWAAYSFNHQSYNSYYFTDGADGELQRVSLKGKYGPAAFTSLACDYVERAARGKKPFALFLSWNPPHDPWSQRNVPPENYAQFADAKFPLPENFKETPDPYMDRYPGYAFEQTENGRRWRRKYLDEGLQENLRCYYAMVNSIDEQFARLTRRLEESGAAENTIVVFTSDHGETFGSHGRMFKLTFYDEAARIPLLVRWPKKVKPGRTDACLGTPDLMPTLLGLMGLAAEIPKEADGEDLSFALRGEPGEEPEAAFLQGLGHTYLWRDGFEWRAVRDKRFTYARYLRDGKELLFDRREDPLCRTDVAADPQYADQLQRLRGWMQAKMEGLGDEFRPCTWYRDRWMYKNYSVKAAARGEFGPLAPIEPKRK